MKRIGSLFVVGLFAGCPEAADPLSSVDGLEGGALTSPLQVPSLEVAGAATAGSVEAGTATVGELTVSSRIDAANASVEAKSVATGAVAAESVAASGAVSAASVEAEVGDIASVRASTVSSSSYALPSLSDDPLSADNGGVLGNIVGVYTLPTNEGVGNHSAANQFCANAFAGSHLCSELEALRFARGTPGGIAERVIALGGTAVVDGASYATFSKAIVGFTGTNEPIVADDCEGWSLSIAGTPPGTHARHVLRIQELSAGVSAVARPDTTSSCSTDDVRLLCCQ